MQAKAVRYDIQINILHLYGKEIKQNQLYILVSSFVNGGGEEVGF